MGIQANDIPLQWRIVSALQFITMSWNNSFQSDSLKSQLFFTLGD